MRSKSLAMDFGTDGNVKDPKVDFKLIDGGEIDDATVITLEPEAGGLYLLACKEWNASSGAYRGHRLHVIAVPEMDRYGSTACQRINTLHSDNAGVTITYANDSTITLERSASTYAVRWAFYRMF